VQRGTQYGIYDTSTTAGTIRFQYFSDSGAFTKTSATVLDPWLTAGVAAEFKHVIDWSETDWYTYIDGTLRATDTVVGTQFAADSGDLSVGGLGTLWFQGDIYWVEVRDGIDGPICAGWYAYDAWTEAQ
jgi:hypothetical protein